MDWQPIEARPDKQLAGLLLFPPSADDSEFFGGRIDIGEFLPCPAQEDCGCGGDWDWPWEERGREPGPTHWMPLPDPPKGTES